MVASNFYPSFPFYTLSLFSFSSPFYFSFLFPFYFYHKIYFPRIKQTSNITFVFDFILEKCLLYFLFLTYAFDFDLNYDNVR
jgi:hypothetical protein